MSNETEESGYYEVLVGKFEGDYLITGTGLRYEKAAYLEALDRVIKNPPPTSNLVSYVAHPDGRLEATLKLPCIPDEPASFHISTLGKQRSEKGKPGTIPFNLHGLTDELHTLFPDYRIPAGTEFPNIHGALLNSALQYNLNDPAGIVNHLLNPPKEDYPNE